MPASNGDEPERPQPPAEGDWQVSIAEGELTIRVDRARRERAVIVEGISAGVLGQHVNRWASDAGLSVETFSFLDEWVMHGHDAEQWGVLVRVDHLAWDRAEVRVRWSPRGPGAEAEETYAHRLVAAVAERWPTRAAPVPLLTPASAPTETPPGEAQRRFKIRDVDQAESDAILLQVLELTADDVDARSIGVRLGARLGSSDVNPGTVRYWRAEARKMRARGLL